MKWYYLLLAAVVAVSAYAFDILGFEGLADMGLTAFCERSFVEKAIVVGIIISLVIFWLVEPIRSGLKVQSSFPRGKR